MEIFQTIWTALTTENEALISIIGIPFVYLEAALTIYLAITLLNLKLDKRQIILYIITIPTVSTITNILFSDTLKVIVNLLFTPLFTIFVLKQNFFKGILIEFLPITLLLISQTIWVNIFNYALNISTAEIIIIPIYKIIRACLDYSFIFIIYLLSKKFNFNITLLDNLPKRTRRILTINFILASYYLIW